MEGEKVDRSSFPADVERNLDGDFPTKRSKEPSHGLDERGVIRIEQPVEGLPIPADEQIELRCQHPHDGIDGPQFEVLGSTELDPGHRRPRDLRGRGEVELAPATTPSQRTNLATEPDRIHSRRVMKATYPALNGVCRTGRLAPVTASSQLPRP